MSAKLALAPMLLSALLLAGCVGRQDPYPVSAQRIQADTEYLCQEIGVRVTGTPQERACCDWLEDQLEEMGFAQESGSLERKGFQGLGDLESENLIAYCNRGSDGPILCVMAHYDSVANSPGAGDNAAAAATLLELARALGQANSALNAEVRLIFLGSEENGYHGSRAYLDSLSREEHQRHIASFNMDISAATLGTEARMVCNTMGGLVDGTYQEGNFLEPVDNLVSRTIDQVHRELYDGEEVPAIHCGESDHLSFHQAGLESANVCWRVIDGPVTVLPKEYHKAGDTPEKLDYDTAAETGRCILAALDQLAGG